MRHLMPIVTPRLVLRPPTLGDLDSIQTGKEDAWPDLQRWMAWAVDNQRSQQRWKTLFDERWITRVKQESHWRKIGDCRVFLQTLARKRDGRLTQKHRADDRLWPRLTVDGSNPNP
jgi:hypothetical protein